MNTLLPGSTIGMLGGGQLGRMFAIEAKRMGYRVIVLDPTEDSSTAQVCDDQIVADFSNGAAVQQLAEQVDVITYEFENVPVNMVKLVQDSTPVLPGARLLEVAQHRGREKQFARDSNIAVAGFVVLPVLPEAATLTIEHQAVQTAITTVGLPAVLKTTTLGYDGKGQWIVRTESELETALQQAAGRELIWEAMVDLSTEISVVATRAQDGQLVTYPIGENQHQNNILYRSVVPTQLADAIQDQAIAIARTIGEQLEVVGTYTVELFITKDQQVLFNEIAPRPHNSGHYTIEGCVTSQFENQVRAVCGLPLGSTALRSAAVAMQNILGDGNGNTLGGIDQLLAKPGVYLHLYGKGEAKANRKMGHVTIVADSAEKVTAVADSIDDTLQWE